MSLDYLNIEGVGEKFNLKTFLSARSKSIETIEVIISQIKSGMSEKDISEIIKAEFLKIGVDKYWHPAKIRISSDTTKTFRDLSDESLRTTTGDHCFLDLGPIIMDHEADFGRTFIVESNEKTKTDMLVQASHNIFEKTALKWKNEKLSGVALFNYANHLAQEYGYELNPKMSGHRLADFPHHIHSRMGLFEFDQKPTENLWVLEIHIIDRKNQRGAFFEDLLLG